MNLPQDARLEVYSFWRQAWFWTLLVLFILGLWSALGSSSLSQFVGSHLLKVIGLGLAYWVFTIWDITFSIRANHD